MPDKCFVPGCYTGYKSNSSGIQFPRFRAPKDESRRKEWSKRIARLDRELTVKDHVCAKHFEETMIEKDFISLINGKEVRTPRHRWKLKDTAFPTQYLELPQRFSKAKEKKEAPLQGQKDKTMLKRKYKDSDLPCKYCTKVHPRYIQKSVTTSPIVVSIRCEKNSEPLKKKSKEKEIISNSEQKIADSLNDKLESPILNETESKIEENGIQEKSKEKEIISNSEQKIADSLNDNLESPILNETESQIEENCIQEKSKEKEIIRNSEQKIADSLNDNLESPILNETESQIEENCIQEKYIERQNDGRSNIIVLSEREFKEITATFIKPAEFETESESKKIFYPSPSLEGLQNSVADFENTDSNHSDFELETQDYFYEYEESFNEVSSPTPITITPTEIQLLVKQQEQLLRQQGQILTALQEFRDIQKEIFSLKQKNYEVKLMKFQITTKEDADVEFATDREFT